MSGSDIFATEQWLIGPYFGSNHPFFSINKHTVIYTWITIAIVAALLFIGRYFVKKKQGIGKHITLSFIEFFV